jgi:glyoxylase-like metal-dependent hydrolase (beta-lactamase superfamily II)
LNLTVAQLKERIARGEPVFVLDVRTAREFQARRIEAATPLATLNVPYTRFLGSGEEDDLAQAAARYIENELKDSIPRDALIVAVCAKGGTSAYVAEGLRALGFEAANLTGGMMAWGDHYDFLPAVRDGSLEVFQVVRAARGCLGYVLASSGEALVVDPFRDVRRYVDFADQRSLRIVGVLDTHAHADHLSGGRALAAELGVSYYLHPYDAIHPMDLLPASFDFAPLWEGRRIPFGAATLEALHVPGHTLGTMAFRLAGMLLTGDTLFIGSIARPDLGGRAEAWTPLHHRSLRRLLGFPPETLVLPGHFASPQEANREKIFAAPLARLREENEGARLALGDAEAFTRYVLASLPEFPPQYVDIKRVNLGLLEADEERAQELELGKNVCALGVS